MATERLSMRQIREILRQKWALRLSHRAVARSLRIGLGTISSVTSRAHAAGLDWAEVQTLPDDVLESRLYGRPEVAGQRLRQLPTVRGFMPSGAGLASPWSCSTSNTSSGIPT